jgi:putative chitinase
MINRKTTFDNIRKEFGALSHKQVDGFNAFFDEYEIRKLTDIRFLAYMLATAWHETAKTMQPIEEHGKGKGKAYEGNYYGRGYVQLTWIGNYTKATFNNKKGWDFVKKPGLMLQVEPAIWVTFEGMINGWFTGKKLSSYFDKDKNQFIEARRIINGTDKAELIGNYHLKFLKSIV